MRDRLDIWMDWKDGIDGENEKWLYRINGVIREIDIFDRYIDWMDEKKR